ncbi:MAG: CBS domain-containing protein [Myxococcales bacterium]|nr:CBS domain-containing protein [Myxococcales bacterium]
MATIWTYVTRNVQTVLDTSALEEVIQLMSAGSFRHVPVVDAIGSLAGIISDRDVRRLLPSPDTPAEEVEAFVTRTVVGDVMTRNPLTIERDSTMLEAVKLTLEHRIGALPVMENGSLIGILSQTDILKAYADYLSTGDDEDLVSHTSSLPSTFADQAERPVVMLVEPNSNLREDLANVLVAASIEVISFDDFASVSVELLPQDPHLILMSCQSELQEDSLELLRSSFPMTPVVVTREGRGPVGNQRQGKGPLHLPCSPETLLRRIRLELADLPWAQRRKTLVSSEVDQRFTATIDIDVNLSRRVLVIDQDPLTRQSLTFYFRQAGCEVVEATDGHEALSRLALENFDIVTLELDLPFRSGFELLEFVQRSANISPHIVVVSGARRDEDLVHAFSLGAVEYIRKPIHQETLSQHLARLVVDEPNAS